MLAVPQKVPRAPRPPRPGADVAPARAELRSLRLSPCKCSQHENHIDLQETRVRPGSGCAVPASPCALAHAGSGGVGVLRPPGLKSVSRAGPGTVDTRTVGRERWHGKGGIGRTPGSAGGGPGRGASAASPGAHAAGPRRWLRWRERVGAEHGLLASRAATDTWASQTVAASAWQQGRCHSEPPVKSERPYLPPALPGR